MLHVKTVLFMVRKHSFPFKDTPVLIHINLTVLSRKVYFNRQGDIFFGGVNFDRRNE